MDRRSFMGAILAAGAAPAIVRAGSLMRIVSRDTYTDPIFGMQWDNNHSIETLKWACEPPARVFNVPTRIRMRIPVALDVGVVWVPSDQPVPLRPEFDIVEIEGEDMAEVREKIEAFKKERQRARLS